MRLESGTRPRRIPPFRAERNSPRCFPAASSAALIVVLTITMLAGWWVLLADEYRERGKDAAGSAGFIANFILVTVAVRAGAGVIDPMESLCAADTGPSLADGLPIYLDTGHLRPSFVRDGCGSSTLRSV